MALSTGVQGGVKNVASGIGNNWRGMAVTWVQRAFAGLYRRARSTGRAVEQTAPMLPIEVQWARTTGFVSDALARADAAGRVHVAAREQIEAARYALDELMRDLGSVMQVERVERRPSVAPTEIAPDAPQADVRSIAA